MDFAGAFGKSAVIASMERQLVPGRVVYILVRFPQGPKPKYLVCVGCTDTADLFFTINSNVNSFISSRHVLNICQVTIAAADHEFLDHNSTIACHEVHRLPRDKVIDELAADVTRLKDMISSEVRSQILAAVKASITLDPPTQRVIIDGLTA